MPRKKTYATNEGIPKPSGRVSKLIGHLLPMSVEPTALDACHTVEVGNAGLRKDTREDISNHTANSVSCENLNGHVNIKKLTINGAN
jgi:hypothetical protein